jgi:hypothetical protein
MLVRDDQMHDPRLLVYLNALLSMPVLRLPSTQSQRHIINVQVMS